MDGNKLPSPCPEVAAFDQYYNHLWERVNRPGYLAQLLYADSVINREVKDSITSKSTDVEQARSVLDAIRHALLQSTHPSATMRSLRRACKEASYRTSSSFDHMEEFVDGEVYAISLIKTGKRD